MNRRSSAPMASGAATSAASSMSRCHQWSRPSCIFANDSSPSPPARRRTTTTLWMEGQSSSASSAKRLRGSTWPRRYPPSAVMSATARASLIRSRSDSAENPPNTTEWTAPIREQASIAIAASGIIGR